MIRRPRNEEGRDLARPAVAQGQRGLRNTLDSTYTGPDQNAALGLVVIAGRMPTSIVERLTGRRHGVDDELVDTTLILRIHPLIGIEGSLGTVPARDLAGDLAGKIRCLEILDPRSATAPLEQPLPGLFHATGEGVKPCRDR